MQKPLPTHTLTTAQCLSAATDITLPGRLSVEMSAEPGTDWLHAHYDPGSLHFGCPLLDTPTFSLASRVSSSLACLV
jgi:hypothetical protein